METDNIPIHEIRTKIPSTKGALLDANIAWSKEQKPNSNIGIIITHPYALLGLNLQILFVIYF